MNKDERIQSFTAAGLLPVKLLLNNELADHIRINRVIPLIHLQINPTSKCQLACPFCSCRGQRNRKPTEVKWELMKEVIDQAVSVGCQSVTITGGGEPILYSHISELIEYCDRRNLDIGLVTNGYLLNKVDGSVLSQCAWIRVSVSDFYGFSNTLSVAIERGISKSPSVDWSISYVVTKDMKIQEIAKAVQFANQHRLTHIRLVSDLLDLKAIPEMDFIKKMLMGIAIDDGLVIYQGRKCYTAGQRDCFISLLKTVFGPDGYLYPCCGSQYAEDPPAMDYPESMRLGKGMDLYHIISRQRWFDGSKCVKCYYSDYNQLLGILRLRNIRHITHV